MEAPLPPDCNNMLQFPDLITVSPAFAHVLTCPDAAVTTNDVLLTMFDRYNEEYVLPLATFNAEAVTAPAVTAPTVMAGVPDRPDAVPVIPEGAMTAPPK